jgi:RimJ/RimL family protein N-acetyltransferase
MERPTFTTARLIVRPRTLADTDALMAMDHDPEVTRFIPGPWADPVAHRAFTEHRTLGPYPAGMGYWSVCAKVQPDVLLGWVSLIPWETIGPRIEAGWRFRRAAWSQGYASEAAAPVVRHGLFALGLSQVIADIDPENLASIRVAEKLGFGPTDLRLKPHYTVGCYLLARRAEAGRSAAVR